MEEVSSQSPSQSQSHDIELGLKSLTLCDQKLHHNSCIMASKLMSPPPSPGSFSQIGDYIGMESCVDMRSCEDVQMMSGDASNASTTAGQSRQFSRNRGKTRCGREFPPPISLLARTENLPSHMPFVLRRYYTSDGRLILREERVRHHEYFRAHRSNGHLTLHLVPLDDDDDDDDDEEEECVDDCDKDPLVQVDDENEKAIVVQEQGELKDDDNEDQGMEELITGQRTHESSKSSSSSNDGIRAMCLNYNNVIFSTSCYRGVPVPAIKPVQT